jgi:hypothetical protein
MATVHTPLVRSLPAARSAYDNQDVALSKLVHSKNIQNTEEGHNRGGDVIKSVVFGGLDGILTTFAIVSGATGGGMSTAVILILGFSNKIGDALSMGLGDALSTKAEHEYVYQVCLVLFSFFLFFSRSRDCDIMACNSKAEKCLFLLKNVGATETYVAS